MIKNFIALAFMTTSFMLVGNAYGEEDVYYCADNDANGFYYDKESDSYKKNSIISTKFKVKIDKAHKSVEVAREDLMRFFLY